MARPKKRQPSRKFQFVLDPETEELLKQISDWTGEDRFTRLIKLGIKDLHYRLSQHREGRRQIYESIPAGQRVYDPLVAIIGKPDS